MKDKKRIQIDVTVEDCDRLDALRARLGDTRTAVIRRALKLYDVLEQQDGDVLVVHPDGSTSKVLV